MNRALTAKRIGRAGCKQNSAQSHFRQKLGFASRYTLMAHSKGKKCAIQEPRFALPPSGGRPTGEMPSGGTRGQHTRPASRNPLGEGTPAGLPGAPPYDKQRPYRPLPRTFQVKQQLLSRLDIESDSIAMRFLNEQQLEQSGVIANCRMNRERNLTGSNGYSKEIGFNPLDLLIERVSSAGAARWLDLCCGSGKALFEAARSLAASGLEDRIAIVGVDLIVPPAHIDPTIKCVRFVEASLARWQPEGCFDLVTCVHGLHYMGDKLGLIARAAAWLAEEGRFAANLDLVNIKWRDGRPAGRAIAAELRASGFQYNSRKKLLTCAGRRHVQFPFDYVGANDQAGPNYTGQAAVDSYYTQATRTDY
jgi:SAM-dependent methyltransferase